MGHPNSIVLSHLCKTGLLGNINVISNSSFSCSVCKLAKSKTLPFLSGAHRAFTCFEMIWGMSHVVSHVTINVLSHLLMIIFVLLGYIFFILNLKCFLCLRNI